MLLKLLKSFLYQNWKPSLKEKCEQKFLVNLTFFGFQDPIIYTLRNYLGFQRALIYLGYISQYLPYQEVKLRSLKSIDLLNSLKNNR